MTLKQNSKLVLDEYAMQIKKNATEAYRAIHPTATDVTARTNAHKLLNKPEAQIYLQKHIDKASSTIVTLLDSEKDDIRLRSATDILDRSHGKATQRVETSSKVLTISIDLTSTED
jgi:hypothetical protein